MPKPSNPSNPKLSNGGFARAAALSRERRKEISLHANSVKFAKLPSVEERFWIKVVRLEPSVFHPGAKLPGCWLWTAALNPKNHYGQFGIGGRKGKGVYVHRFSYEMAKGPIPDDLEIDHLCRVRNCVNPDHLEAVTGAINSFRARKTHCIRGHELTPDNLRWYKNGTARQCKKCALMYSVISNAKTKADPARRERYNAARRKLKPLNHEAKYPTSTPDTNAVS